MRFLRLAPSELLLRLAVAFAFLYPPIDAVLDPYSWIGYFPSFVLTIVAPHSLLLLHAFGVVEVVIAVWIVFGKDIRIPTAVATLLLLAIVITNPAQFQVVFRDLSIAIATLSLMLMNGRAQKRTNGTA